MTARKETLTVLEANFCTAYIRYGSAAEAYRQSYGTEKQADGTIYANCKALMKKPHIIQRIRELQESFAIDTLAMRRMLMEDWLTMSRVDVNEIVEVRHVACRRCHGVGFNYQWRTEDEFVAEYTKAFDRKLPLPNDLGGYGFNGLAEPHPKCPYCDGAGNEEMILHDSRTLTGGARKLYAGAKMGKSGRIEYLLESKEKARDSLARALSVFDDALKITLNGGLKPAELTAVDAVEAARQYERLLQGVDDAAAV